jgi:hypothetical protein
VNVPGQFLTLRVKESLPQSAPSRILAPVVIWLLLLTAHSFLVGLKTHASLLCRIKKQTIASADTPKRLPVFGSHGGERREKSNPIRWCQYQRERARSKQKARESSALSSPALFTAKIEFH